MNSAYELLRHFVTTANADGWVKFGQPIKTRELAKLSGVTRRTVYRCLAALRADSHIETEQYAGRGLRVRIAPALRKPVHQLPLFNGPQVLRKTVGKARKTCAQ